MRQKGGSVASDAVTSLVNADTYTSMDKMFSNDYSSVQCGGKRKKVLKKCKKGGDCDKLNKKKDNKVEVISSRCALCGGSTKKQNGGNLMDMVNSIKSSLNIKSPFVNSSSVPSSVPVNVLKSSSIPVNVLKSSSIPVNVLKSSSAPLVSGGSSKKKSPKKKVYKIKKGGKLSFFNDNDDYSLKNKKGGGTSSSLITDNIGLHYDTIKHTNIPLGADFNRSIASNETASRILASEPIPSLPLLTKTVTFGLPFQKNVNFNYQTNSISVAQEAPRVGGGKQKVRKVRKVRKIKK